MSAHNSRWWTYGIAQGGASAMHSNASKALWVHISSVQGCQDKLPLGRPVGRCQG